MSPAQFPSGHALVSVMTYFVGTGLILGHIIIKNYVKHRKHLRRHKTSKMKIKKNESSDSDLMLSQRFWSSSLCVLDFVLCVMCYGCFLIYEHKFSLLWLSSDKTKISKPLTQFFLSLYIQKHSFIDVLWNRCC